MTCGSCRIKMACRPCSLCVRAHVHVPAYPHHVPLLASCVCVCVCVIRVQLTTQSMTALHTYAQALYEQVAARTLRSRPPSRLNGTGLTSSPSPAPAAGRNLLARERYLFQV